MATNLSLGRLEPDKDNVGGLKNVYFINRTTGLESSATFDSDEQITAFASLLTLLKYELRGTGHSFSQTTETSGDNGTTFTTQTLTFNLKVQGVASRKELQLASFNMPHIIVQDYNGNYQFMGLENGCDVNVDTVSGGAMGDLNGYTVTVTATEKNVAHFVSSSIIGDDTNTSITVGT